MFGEELCLADGPKSFDYDVVSDCADCVVYAKANCSAFMPFERYCERIMLLPRGMKNLCDAIAAKLQRLDGLEKNKNSLLQTFGLQSDERQKLVNDLGA